MSNESLQTIILGIVAIVLVLQISMLVVAALLVTRVHKRFEELVADAREMVRIMRLRAEQWEVTMVQAGRIVQIVQNRVEHADGVAKELLNRSLRQTLAADRIISDLLSTLESATQEVKEVVKKPLREARALNAAVRAAVAYLASHGSSRTNERGGVHKHA
jgi:L-2-hydroxyglutarate oxidase LhgO